MALLEGFAVVVAKFAGAGTVAQVATGLGIAAAGVTGAGAAGALPAPVQDAVASAVESVTPFELPESTDSADEGLPTGDAPQLTGTVEPTEEAPEAPTEEPTEEAPEESTDEPTDEATEDGAGDSGLRGLDNAIAHADEHAQESLAAAQARKAAHDTEKASRDAAREAEKAARDAAKDADKAAREAAKAARDAAAPVEESVEEAPAGAEDAGRGKR
ncbi:hypothetical protein [Blastococcus sp. SYSU DS0539]